MKTEIIYEDQEILVVYKPAGLAVQSAKVGQMDVVSELKNYLRQSGKHAGTLAGQGAPYLGMIHRLDQPVEGLLVFAKSKKAAEALSGQLQKQGDEGAFHKRYSAVFCGQVAASEGELVDFLYKNKENKAMVAEGREVPGAKRAVLQYRILRTREAAECLQMVSMQSSLDGKGITVPQHVLALADIQIRTGRFHQIRAQMAHAGMPLLGDLKYGDEEANAFSKQAGISSVALCACNLAFRHPATDEKMSFTVEPRGRAFSFFA